MRMPAVKFNLTLGMKNEQLWAELRGRISGETAQQTQLIFKKDAVEDIPLPLVEMIKLDEIREAAIIRKNDVQKDSLGGLQIIPHYFIVGVNDEGAYYAHEMTEIGWPSLLDVESPSLERLLMWMNRADQGFTRRIQGDVLAQIVAPQAEKSERPQTRSSTSGGLIDG
jgi:hypothetical protein